MASALRRTASFSAVISPGTRMAKPGPGNGWRRIMRSGRPSLRPSARTSSLNSSRQLKRPAPRQPPEFVMRLKGAAGAAGKGHSLDDVRVERPLREEIGAAKRSGLFFKHIDEEPADDLALAFRVCDAGQAAEEER